MIVTITPNPSVDRTVTVGRLERGVVIRATDSREDPGGKGLNVSRALALNGTATAAVFPVGGVYGRLMLNLLEDDRVDLRPVQIARTIRANITVVEPDGTTTKINEPGPLLDAAEVAALEAGLLAASEGAEWVVCCGSLPPGLPGDFFASVVRTCHDRGIKVAVDTSGAPMEAALGLGPDLIKPNRVELAEVVGADLTTVGQVVEAARRLVAAGVGTVVISLGRDGALLVDADTVAHAVASVVEPLSTVGAGDSLLAGYLHAIDNGLDKMTALASAVAFGAAAVSLPGSKMPGPDQVASVQVRLDRAPDPMRPLDD